MFKSKRLVYQQFSRFYFIFFRVLKMNKDLKNSTQDILISLFHILPH